MGGRTMKRIIALCGTVILVLAFSLTAAAKQKSAAFASLSESGGGSKVKVFGPLTSYYPLDASAWGDGKNAVEAWKHPDWPTLTGTKWISNTYKIGDDGSPVATDTWRRFALEVMLPCTAYNVRDGSVDATADNAEEVYLNGDLVGTDGEVQGVATDNFEWNTIQTYPLAFEPGRNLLEFIVRNYPGGDNPENNPTGLLFAGSVFYEVPDVTWLPPLSRKNYELKYGATASIKFQLFRSDHTVIKEAQEVQMVITGAGLPPEGLVFSLGTDSNNLRFNAKTFRYVLTFKSKDYPLVKNSSYLIKVIDACSKEELGGDFATTLVIR